VVDPISAFRGPHAEIHATLVRLADICKTKGITTIFTSLSTAAGQMDEAERSVSSLMDTWVSLRDIEANGERNRVLYLLKARGMSHSNQLREYRLTDDGIEMIDAYIGPGGVLTGSARVAQEARERERDLQRLQDTERRQREVARKRAAAERQIAELTAALEAEENEATTLIDQEQARETALSAERETMAIRRGTQS
jgi:circadian clock protein KaiC